MSRSTAPAPISIYYLSEQALTVEFGDIISDELSGRVSSLNALLHQKPFVGFTTTVPAYTTLTIFFDPLLVTKSDLAGETCFEKVSAYLKQLNHQTKVKPDKTVNTVIIPVCYGGGFGPDLDEVAKLHQLDKAEVIRLHSAVAYKVYMIGFVPGFAYLGGMDERLTTPRKAAPRKAVPAGSVGIAGAQTGVYPMQTPGGWQIIGQTPIKLFDADRAQPSLLQAGDEVIFKPVNRAEFDDLAAKL